MQKAPLVPPSHHQSHEQQGRIMRSRRVALCSPLADSQPTWMPLRPSSSTPFPTVLPPPCLASVAAGWGPGQLEEEVRRGVWFPAAASSSFILQHHEPPAAAAGAEGGAAPPGGSSDLAPGGERMWHEILNLMGGEYSDLSAAMSEVYRAGGCSGVRGSAVRRARRRCMVGVTWRARAAPPVHCALPCVAALDCRPLGTSAPWLQISWGRRRRRRTRGSSSEAGAGCWTPLLENDVIDHTVGTLLGGRFIREGRGPA